MYEDPSPPGVPVTGSDRDFRRSLRSKVLLWVVVTVVLIQTVVAVARYSVIREQQYRDLDRDIEATAAEVERILAEPLYNYHEREVATVLEAKLLGVPWLRSAVVVDGVTGEPYVGLRHTESDEGLVATDRVSEDGMYRVVSRPLAFQGRALGRVDLAFSDTLAKKLLQRILQEHLLVLVVEVVVLVGAIVLAIHHMVVRPLREAVAAADAIRRGDLSRREVDPRGDEFDQLAIALNDMRSSLRRQLADLAAANRRLEQAMRLKTSFLANMSHEIRTPMNGVIGSAQLLDLTDLDQEQAELVATMQRSGEAVLGVINDILDLSKIEAGEMQLEVVPCDLRALVDDVAGLLVDVAERKGLRLGVAVDPSLDRPVACDPLRLRQILLNLGDNAVKFTTEGSVTLSCTLVARTGDTCRLQLAVRDTGIGIASEIQSSLFQPFMQADGSTTRQFGGTGLGLTISKQLTELMGGTIELRSHEGRGSTFSVELTLPFAGGVQARPRCAGHSVALRSDDAVTVDGVTAHFEAAGVTVRSAGLASVTGSGRVAEVVVIDLASAGPAADIAGLVAEAEGPCVLLVTRRQRRARSAELAEVDAPVVAHPPRATALWEAVTRAGGFAAESDGGRRGSHVGLLAGRVLVVEDHPDNRAVIARMAQALGLEVETVVNGRAAVEWMRHNEADVILMDCHMPIMDGFDATGALREAGCRIPIVALTANALSEDRDRCLAAGMDEHLAKPVTRERLFEVLSRYLTSDPEPDAAMEAGGS